jgi:phosphopantothenoylcysteine decarboxylase/phosphopantothenate--cysteine ligase
MPTIHLIISGGIAAYKTLELIRRLREHGWRVIPILTDAAKEFVTPLSVSALAGERIYDTLWSLTDEAEMGHIRLARDPDLIVVAPATANIMAKMAHGEGTDLATTVLLATDRPVLIAPAMNPHMWQNAATRDNVKTLLARGVTMVGPEAGDMACGEIGTGRMAEVTEILAAIKKIAGTKPLAGKHAIVTAGATREMIDPVRFISNRSSGRQALAIANALARAGAKITLIHGIMQTNIPNGMYAVQTENADDMWAAVRRALPADIFIGAAAVADYAPVEISKQKIKKSNDGNITLALCHTVDILKSVSAHPQRPELVIGFALESENLIENAHTKLGAKNCDWIIANDASAMDSNQNKITLLSAYETLEWPLLSKDSVGQRLAEKIVKHFANGEP